MIIGPEFSDRQIRESSNYPFELWKATLYDNDEIIYQRIDDGERRIIQVSPDELTLTENNLLVGKSDLICDLYHKLKNRILCEFDDVHEVILIDALAFKRDKKNHLHCKH